MNFLRMHRDVVAVGSQVRRLGPDGGVGDLHHSLPLEHEDIVLRLLRYWSIWHPSVLFRREAGSSRREIMEMKSRLKIMVSGYVSPGWAGSQTLLKRSFNTGCTALASRVNSWPMRGRMRVLA